MSKIKSFSVKSADRIETHATGILQIIGEERASISSFKSDLSFISETDPVDLREKLESLSAAMAEARNIGDFLGFAFHAYKQLEVMLKRMITRLDRDAFSLVWNFLQARRKARDKEYTPNPVPSDKDRIFADDRIELFFIKAKGPQFSNTLPEYLITEATGKLRNLYGHGDPRDLTERVDETVRWKDLNELVKKLLATQDYKRIHDNLNWVLREAYKI